MPPKQPEIIIISKNESPWKALSRGEAMAKVRYSIKLIEGNKWSVVLTRGKLNDLLKAVESSPSLELLEVLPEDGSIDVDLGYL